jgi:hypothetical protein
LALIELFPGTLKKLDIELVHCGRKVYIPADQGILTEILLEHPLPKVTPVLLLNLEQLVIRTSVYRSKYSSHSKLSEAAQVINLFISPPRHLVLDINLQLNPASHITKVDFSPLAVLGTAPLSIPRIDLYVHTGVLSSADTRAQLLSSLGKYDDILRLINGDGLVIHSEEIFPDF